MGAGSTGAFGSSAASSVSLPCPVGRRIQASRVEIDAAPRAIDQELTGTTLAGLARGTRAAEFGPAMAA